MSHDPVMMSNLSLYAVFLTGLLGGVHCAGMCGGIVSALGMMHQKGVGSLRGIPVSSGESAMAVSARSAVVPSAIVPVSLYNLGRISTYTLLGTVAGAVGSMAWMMDSILPIQQTAYLISNLLLVLMGLYVIGIKRLASIVEKAGAGLWQHISPLATRTLTRSGAGNSIVAGGLWGLVPCGMVYAVLSAALVSGSAVKGAMLMLVFGLGTLPNLMLLGLSGQWLARASRNRIIRVFAGLLIIGFGLMGLMHLSMMASQ